MIRYLWRRLRNLDKVEHLENRVRAQRERMIEMREAHTNLQVALMRAEEAAKKARPPGGHFKDTPHIHPHQP